MPGQDLKGDRCANSFDVPWPAEVLHTAWW